MPMRERQPITSATAHGLDGSLVEPDWPPLALDELHRLFHHYPQCGEPLDILSVSPRPFSAASVVSVSSGRVFVKRHHQSVRDLEGLFEEHRFLAHLLAHGARVPRVLATSSGVTAVAIGPWTYEIHTVPDGIDLYRDAISWTPFLSPDHARSAGQALAQLHLAGQGYDGPPRRPCPLVASFTIFRSLDPCAACDDYLSVRPALRYDSIVHSGCDQALSLLRPFYEEMRPLLPALPGLWTHNDLHASNLMWSDSGPSAHPTAIIDFGLADRTTAIYDIAHTIERNIVEWLFLVENPDQGDHLPIHLDHLHALLDGYRGVRPLSCEEAAALAPITALCHAEFALTEADYFLGTLYSTEKARIAVIDYLVGHSRWYRSSRGQTLLDAIRSWAGGQR